MTLTSTYISPKFSNLFFPYEHTTDLASAEKRKKYKKTICPTKKPTSCPTKGLCCVNGQYNDPVLKKCVDCLPSYYSPKPSTQCMKCPSGQYSGLKSSCCYTCPAGSKVNPTQTGCVPDVPVPPTPAPTRFDFPGSISINPARSSPPTRAPCVPGQYDDPVAKACVDCLPSFYSPSPDMKCMKCAAGLISGAKAAICTECPAGSKANAEQTACVTPEPTTTPTSPPTSPPTKAECVPGQYDDPVAKACVDCLPSFYSPSPDMKCMKCAAGSISGAKATVCITCAAGEAPNAGQTECVKIVTDAPSQAPTIAGAPSTVSITPISIDETMPPTKGATYTPSLVPSMKPVCPTAKPVCPTAKPVCPTPKPNRKHKPSRDY